MTLSHACMCTRMKMYKKMCVQQVSVCTLSIGGNFSWRRFADALCHPFPYWWCHHVSVFHLVLHSFRPHIFPSIFFGVSEWLICESTSLLPITFDVLRPSFLPISWPSLFGSSCLVENSLHEVVLPYTVSCTAFVLRILLKDWRGSLTHFQLHQTLLPFFQVFSSSNFSLL